MYVIHTSMTRCGADIPTIYAAQVVACRWTNKKLGKWTGRFIRDTGDSFKVSKADKLHSAAIRAKCDELSRQVAKRLGMQAGPDVFPFS